MRERERGAPETEGERERRETGRESGEGNNLDFCRCWDASIWRRTNIFSLFHLLIYIIDIIDIYTRQ